LVTGGAGFIGSHFVKHLLLTYPSYTINILDALTYAGKLLAPDLPVVLSPLMGVAAIVSLSYHISLLGVSTTRAKWRLLALGTGATVAAGERVAHLAHGGDASSSPSPLMGLQSTVERSEYLRLFLCYHV
jgi:nucleoside-diphosphate-sugar epimerase